jgi:hypothetical protein
MLELLEQLWNSPIPWFWIIASLAGLSLLAILIGVIGHIDARRSK